MVNIQSKLPINNRINNNDIINNINNNINYNITYGIYDDYDFFNNEQKYIRKRQNKLMNLKNEKITQLEEQCTFSPKINNRYKYPKNEKGINIYEKLYNKSTNNRIKKEEKIKKYLDELKFTPNIEVNDKYKIKSSFEERRLKSIELKAKLKRDKIIEEEKKLKDASIKRKVNKDEVIKRLYNKEMDKIKEKNKKEKKLKEKEDKKRKL
jgi:hypothetical protein